MQFKSSVFALTFLVIVAAYGAENRYFGELVNVPSVIKVIDQNGQVQELQVPNSLNRASIRTDAIAISRNGVMSTCATIRIGKLKEEFIAAIRLEDGSVKIVRVSPKVSNSDVFVEADCDSDKNTISEGFYLVAKKKDGSNSNATIINIQ